MTIATEAERMQYSGSGTVGPFSFPYKFFADGDLTVIRTDTGGIDTVLTLTSDYTVDGAGESAGGTITLVDEENPLAVGEKITIMYGLAYTQVTDYAENDEFPAETHEDALDRATILIQQLKEIFSRCLKFGEASAFTNVDVADLVAGNVLTVNDAADGISMESPSDWILDGSIVASTFGKAFVEATHGIYLVDPSATDQGAATAAANRSIKDLVDSIGAGKAELWFRNSGATTTTYTVSTNETIPSNITCRFFSGAIISVDAGKALTINGPILSAPVQIFSGSGTIVGDPITPYTLPEWFGALGDGSTNDTAAITAAMTHWLQRTWQGTFKFLAGKKYKMNTGITLTLNSEIVNGWVIDGEGSNILSGLSSGYVLALTLGTATNIRNLTVKGLTMYGSGSEDGGLKIDGGDLATKYFYHTTLSGLRLENFGGNALMLSGDFFESTITDVFAGCTNLNTTGYAIYITNGAGTGIISSIVMSNILTSYGKNGIYCKAPAGDVVLHGVTAIMAYEYGINLENNFGGTVLNAHVENNWQGAADLANGQAGLFVQGGATISGVYGTTNDKQKYVVRLYANDGLQVHVHGGTMTGDTVKYAYVHAHANGKITFDGVQTWECSDDPQGSISRRCTLYKEAEPAQSAGTGEDDMMSWAVPAGVIGQTGVLRVTAFGGKFYANGNKTIKFYFGSTSITIANASATTWDFWRIVVDIQNYRDTTSQILSYTAWDGSTVVQGQAAATEDTDGGAITIKCTGECAHADDVINQRGMIIEGL